MKTLNNVLCWLTDLNSLPKISVTKICGKKVGSVRKTTLNTN